MNIRQKTSLWLGGVLFSVSNLWPPWSSTSRVLSGRESFRGFFFISHDFGWTPAHIVPDFSRMILEDAVIVAVTLVAVLTMKGQAEWRIWPIARHAAVASFSRYQQAVFALTLLGVGLLLVSGANWQLSFGILLLGLTLALIIGSDNKLLHYVCLTVGLATVATPAYLSWRQHRGAALEFNRSVQRFEAAIPQLAQRYPLNAGCPVGSQQGSAEQIDVAADSPRTASGKASHRVEFNPIAEGGIPADHQVERSVDWARYEVVGEEQVISINNSTELHAVLTQMGYPEGEKESIEARIAKRLDSTKIDRADFVFPCLSNPKSHVDFQISSAGESKFLSPLPPWFMDAVLNGVNVSSVPVNEKPETVPPPFRVLPALWSLPLVSVLGVVIASAGLANLILAEGPGRLAGQSRAGQPRSTAGKRH
jgi:hypothetical protein